MQQTTYRKRGSIFRMPNMRASAAVISVIFGVAFLCMCVYFVRFALKNQRKLMSNSYNTHQAVLAKQISRGSIYASDGTVLALNEKGEDGKDHRSYPFGSLYAHAVGYASKGKSGIESAYNYYLINSSLPLSEKVKYDTKGEKYPGDSVYSTLDPALQQISSSTLGVYDGAVVVSEIKTGRVLAMVSKPDFDPNEIDEIWEKIQYDASSTVLLNRVKDGQYPPGSTFKIFSSLEFIRENPEDFSKYRYTCNGKYRTGDDYITCYHGTVHGNVDFKTSFSKSCNSSYANIGMSLDRTLFLNTLEECLFDKPLPSDLPCTKSSVGISPSLPDGDMMEICIGQGLTSVTPLHLNLMTCAVANGGVLMKSRLVDRVEDENGTTVAEFKPETYGSLMNEADSLILRGMMEEVVKSGTGRKLNGLSYTAAGKTGSAEFGTIKGQSHAWFTGYAPAEDPEIAVTVIIEGAGSGGDYAVPLTKRIFDQYFGAYSYVD